MTLSDDQQQSVAPSRRHGSDRDDELAWMPGWRLRELFAARKLSPLEYARFLLNRIDRNRNLGAFITVDGDDLIDGAAAATKLNRPDLPLLHGLPVSVKDLIYTKGLRTTMGSRLLTDFVPNDDAVAVERVRRAGGIVFAKTNTPEFGKYLRTMNLIASEACNPWDTSCTAGGSSGGAAVAIAAGLGPLTVGGDGGGSIRLPAAFNGIFGLKPSLGRVPEGAGLYSSPTVAIGPMTRTVRDAATLLQVMAGFDGRDAFSMRTHPPDYLSELEAGVEGVRMAWSADFGWIMPDEPEVVAICHEAARSFSAMGAVYSEPAVRVENPMDPLEQVQEYSPAAVDKRLRELAPDFLDSFTWIAQQPPEKRELLTDYVANMGNYVDIEGFLNSISPKARACHVDRLSDLFDRVDLLMSPTIARRAFVREGGGPSQLQYTAYTLIFNQSGHCAATVPAGFYEGMPVGLQIIGRQGEEALVMRAARALERERPWAHHHPIVA
jgi:Asp-tRNA(Asn)/Glu-tRNA(Gln) amidotransferase A subunit family amidase